jgi:hypothetical protein
MPKNKRRQVSKSAAFIPSSRAASPRVAEFNPDYTYIRRDLGRIGMIAGGFFVVLIALSFFLH